MNIKTELVNHVMSQNTVLSKELWTNPREVYYSVF